MAVHVNEELEEEEKLNEEKLEEEKLKEEKLEKLKEENKGPRKRNNVKKLELKGGVNYLIFNIYNFAFESKIRFGFGLPVDLSVDLSVV